MSRQDIPCAACREKVCLGKDCPRWQVSFLERWQGVNSYAWRQADELGRRRAEKFCYELPHMVRSPCADCRCRRWCDTPCSLRLRWWDERVRGRSGELKVES